MKKYKLLGGGTMTAETNREMAEKLNLNSLFGYENDLNVFMRKTAEACRWQNGSEIRTGNCDEFIEDLEVNGFLTEIREGI